MSLGLRIKKLPVWTSRLENLIRLELQLLESTNDSMKIVQALPNLLVLILLMRNCDQELHLKEVWFLKLHVLYLMDTIKLKWMMIEKSAIPSLTGFWIGLCSLMKEIPTRIEHLRSLKELLFLIMLEEVYCIIRNEN